MANTKPKINEHFLRLDHLVRQHKELGDKLDALRIDKAEQDRRFEAAFFEKRSSLEEWMEGLTLLADGMLQVTLELARAELRPVYGLPRFTDNDGNFLASGFAIIGMGKLGGRELHFGSDLDLIFVFDRNGNTQGPRALSNREYFAKLAQRMISYLSLHTRYGYLYKVDTELRPSGNAGTLVTNLETWISYYHEHAALWEKQALLKARLIHADEGFDKPFAGLFKRLIFLNPFPESFGDEINRLRQRIERELAKESNRRWHYKKGFGGVIDIEFMVQFLQLKLGKVYDSILTPNTLEAIERLATMRVLNADEIADLKKAYRFYREMEIYLEVKYKLKEGYLDPENEWVPQLAEDMGFSEKDDFLQAFDRLRQAVRRIYGKVFHVDGA